MKYNGIKAKSLKLQEGDSILEMRHDASSSDLSGAYISKDGGTSFEKLMGQSDNSILLPFEPNKFYVVGQMIIEDNVIYTRKTDGISLNSLGEDIANWNPQTRLHTSGNRHVRFNLTSNSYTSTITDGWRPLINFNYIEGDSSMISDGDLIAPVSGLYYLDFDSGVQLTEAGSSQLQLFKYPIDSSSSSPRIAHSNVYSSSAGPTIYCIRHLEAGDKLNVRFNTSKDIGTYFGSMCEFGLIAEDSSEGPLAEGEIVQYTSSVTSEIPIALENITNPTVLSTDGCITLPEDGTYYFNVDSLLSNANSKIAIAKTYLRKNAVNGTIIAHNMYTDAFNLQICSLSGIISGSAGDKYYITHAKTAAQSNLTYDDIKRYVRIIKIKSTSIKLCSQDLYNEYLDKIPTGITPMDYESWLKTIISQNQMRVKAKIENQTRAASGIIQHKFIFAEGEQSMLSDNTFVAPFSGMYMINVPGLATSATHSTSDAGATIVIKGIDTSSDSSLLGFSMANSTVTIPSVSTVCWLNKGEVLSIWWNETGSTSRTLLRNNYEAFVEFVLIQSGHPYVNFPNLWTPGVEYDLGNGLYGQRFTGTSAISDKTALTIYNDLNTAATSLIDCGGNWSILNSSYAAIHEFSLNAHIGTAYSGAWLSKSTSTSFYCRFYREDPDASQMSYDVWVKYTK